MDFNYRELFLSLGILLFILALIVFADTKRREVSDNLGGRHVEYAKH